MDGDIGNAKDDEIRRHAYRIWEDEGRPADKAEEHWRKAEQAVAGAAKDIAFVDEPAHDEPAAKPKRKPAAKRAGAAAAAPAERPKGTRARKPK